MSITPSRKMLCAASAASLSAMMTLMAPAPVGASPMRPLHPPGGCDSYTMPAGLIIKQSDGTVITVNNGAGADLSGAQASYTTNGKVTTGNAHGGSAGRSQPQLLHRLERRPGRRRHHDSRGCDDSRTCLGI